MGLVFAALVLVLARTLDPRRFVPEPRPPAPVLHAE